ncbi:EAL domain-containing protein [Paenibacillus qinlingensis]|uniref:Diguanylate cyclase (GGDEF)-like protein/PAS domain S-box-containing protein n=1 Tax=Paenibacillus qinlingensis TaxID=1837343 RepID=A0ABU1NP54_9BACL|nr:EAL domain-containing protein [Paenibacillus qinlingensis]MDR6549245.1 diguanylate cyclase (GGDEF)-like protein/PAS domain S-box-containing protein [Paenibacillus qinlingensis]
MTIPATTTLDLNLLQMMLDDIEDSIYIMKVSGTEIMYYYVNQAATKFSGITMDRMGTSFFESNSSQMAAYLYKKYARVVEERRTIRFEDGVKLPNGMHSGESILTPILDENGTVSFIFSVTRDITERKQQENMLYYYAYQDDLSNLFNRRYLLEHVVEPSTIYLLDLDNFKNINDTFGHQAGDSVLVEVACRLIEEFGDNRYSLVRLGGDEFVVVDSMPAIRTEETAEQLCELFHAPFRVDEHAVKVNVSIGIAERKHEETIQDLLKQADIALYTAKGSGRKRYHLFEASSRYNHVENFIHELALSQAIDKDELHLHYQLIYNPASGRAVGAEALLRWHSKNGGPVQPSDFIPIAEETGLIVPIGYWVIRQSCKDWHQLKEMYGPLFKISVNISRIQLNEEFFVGQVLQILKEEGVEPSVMELEITESTTLHSLQEVQLILSKLRGAGFTIALDDFGTGYSSLSMLTLLPIDKLKIDRLFIADGNVPLIAAILAMAKALNLLVVAEGIETSDHFHMLSDMQCWGIQGYFINKPKPITELPSRLDLSIQ